MPPGEPSDPYRVWVSEVMLQQVRVETVARHYAPFLERWPTVEALAAAPLEEVLRGWSGLGRYARAHNLHACARLLVERHGGEVPRTREELEALPGVGRKTANVVLNVMFGEATMAVDTHIFRLGNRTGLAPGRTPREVEDGLVARCPPALLRDAHHWLILHGRYVCKARLPECWRCVALRFCNYGNKVLAPPAPAAAPARKRAG